MRTWQSHPLFRFLASLKLAVIVILSLAAILSAATILESWYGMRGAHLLVYGQLWFYAVLFLLGLNVFCAALSRYPWKPHQTGFVITHLGILVLLGGSWLTAQFGVDGNLPVIEGDKGNEVLLADSLLTLSDLDAKTSQSFPLPETAVRSAGRLLTIQMPGDQELVAEEYLPRSRMIRDILPSPIAGLGIPAVRLEISNPRFTLDEWLLGKEGAKPTKLNLGPAVVSLRVLESAAQEPLFLAGKLQEAQERPTKGQLVVGLDGRQFRIQVEEGLGRWLPLAGTKIQVRLERYLPHALVKNNQLVNGSEKPVNPALQIFVRADGREEKHTLFSNYPDLESLHGRDRASERLPLKLRFTAPPLENEQNVRGRMHFAQTADGKRLLYRITKREGEGLSQGTVTIDRAQATGWMDLQFKVLQWIPFAIEKEEPRYLERQPSENVPSAVRIRWQGQSRWLTEANVLPVPVGDRMLELSYGRDRLVLPFAIRLKKFTMGTNPGTDKAASYESQVEVDDALATAPAGEVRISMNEPLHYGGYTFYQASYQLRDDLPPVSVFSVNYDPGRMVKYAGSLIMVLGIAIMFYMNPHYWAVLFGQRKER